MDFCFSNQTQLWHYFRTWLCRYLQPSFRTNAFHSPHTSILLTLKDGIRCSLSICLSRYLTSRFCVSDPHTEWGLSAPVRQRCRISPVNDRAQCVAAMHIHLFSINVMYVFFMLPLGLERLSVRALCMLMAPHTCSFQLLLRNGAKTLFAATSINMSDGKMIE